MTPDEKKMQAKKIRLMRLAIVGGLLFSLYLFNYLDKILQALRSCTL